MSNGYLLDTNVVSEVIGRSPTDERVAAFLEERGDLWLSAVVIHELEYGLLLLPQGRRRTGLGVALASFVIGYEDRILPLDRPAAEQAAELRARSQQAGRPFGLADALIAGTAKAHGMTVATRNVTDFGRLDVGVLNPWQAP